ncbi:MAG: hypothetical protein RMJ29_06250 [Candidatus Bipolaricaulota bacterium]|nr:hypothetical protein [Candidatus Bipolaricaulota bacterium]
MKRVGQLGYTVDYTTLLVPITWNFGENLVTSEIDDLKPRC